MKYQKALGDPATKSGRKGYGKLFALTIFAPFYDPEVVVTVLVENGGQGSEIGAPIARDVLREYFEKK